jgi:hypothetical protein
VRRTIGLARWARMALGIGAAGILAVGCRPTPVGSLGTGSPAPDFTLPESGGGQVGLADFSGEPVLLYFHMALG